MAGVVVVAVEAPHVVLSDKAAVLLSFIKFVVLLVSRMAARLTK
jgi:hypothetical protein